MAASLHCEINIVGESMRGFVLSLISLLLFYTVLLYAIGVVGVIEQSRVAETSVFAAERMGYLVDDLSSDISNLVMVQQVQNITISDNFAINKSQFFAQYLPLIANYSNISGANMSISYSDPLAVNFLNSIQYSTKSDGTYWLLKNQSGPVATQYYHITIIANEKYSTYFDWSWVTNGTYVNISYSDPVRTFSESGYINASVLNTFEIRYGANWKILIYAGLIEGNTNAFAVNQTVSGLLSRTNLTISVAPSSATYNIQANIILPTANFSSSLPA